MSDGWETADSGWETANDGWETAESPGIVDTAIDSVRGVLTGASEIPAQIMSGGANLLATALPDSMGDPLRKKAQELYDFNKASNVHNYGKVETPVGEVTQGVTQGLGAVGGLMMNPVAGMGMLAAQAQHGGQEALTGLEEKGVDPTTSRRAAGGVVTGNMLLGLIPGAGAVRGALMNWATGQATDMATYEYLAQKGYTEAADAVIGKRGIVDKQGVIDILVGGFGGKVEAKANADSAKSVKDRLDALDKAKEEQKRTQGEGTLYVGKDGDVTNELPTKITESPEQLEAARTELERQLQEKATRNVEGQQLELLDESGKVIERQQELDLQPQTTPAEAPVSPASAGPTGDWKSDFAALADAQRGKPESAMLKAVNQINDLWGKQGRNIPSSGVFGHLLEHVGDLTHRMSESYGHDGGFGIEYVGSKITTALRILRNEVDMRNLKKFPLEDVPALKEYAEEHSKLPTYNRAQRLAKMAAVELGRGDFEGAYRSLSALDKMIKDGTYKTEAGKYEPTPKRESLLSDTGNIFTPDESGTVNRLVDIQKLPSYDKETGEFNPVEYLTSIRDSHVEGKNRAYRAVYDMILKAFSKMPEGRLPRFALDIDPLTQKPRDLTYDRTGNMGKDAAGQYDPNTDVVWLGRRGETEGTLVHETIHALTSRALHLYKPSDVRVRGLYKIFESVKKDPAFRDQYGTTDIHEFIAETFSSPTFQARLAQHQLTGVVGKARNALHAIVKEIVSALGYKTFSPENRIFTNALEEIVFNTEKLVDLYAENKKSFDEMWLKAVPQSVNVESIPTRTSRSIDAITNNSISVARAAAKAQLSDPDTVKANLIEKVSGEMYIPENPKIDDNLIAKIAKEPDGSNTWNLTPGANARAELANSTLVKTVYRLMNNAYKRAEYDITKMVKPAQDTFISILRNPQKAAISHDILMREMKKGNDYTAEELRAAGVSDDIIKAHLEFRAMMQDALEKQNRVLRDKGLPEVTALESYVSSRWSGPWRVNIKDSEGNIVWQVAEHTKKRAMDAVEWIKQKEPNLVYDEPKYRKGFERGDNVEAGYLDMLKVLDKDDPRVATLESIYKDYLLNNTENVSSQEKHFLKKKGVRGFAGDRAWSDTDIRDFFEQQFTYAENAYRWSEAQKSMEDVKKLINNKDLQESQKNNIQFSKEYIKNQLGFGKSEAFEAIDNGAARLLGTSPQELQKYMGAAKTLFYLSKLGLSLPFTVTQFLQPAITTPGWHSKLSTEGIKHNPIQTTFKSIYGGAQAALWHYGTFFNSPELTKAAEKTMSKLDIEAAKYMEANGVVDINPMTDIKKGLRPAAVNAVAAPFEFTIKHSEVVARSMAFMGFVDHLKQSGKYDTKTAQGRLELFQKAEDMTNLSMTDYRTQERALVFEKMGLTGDAAATLHSYQINNLMQLLKFGQEAANGNPRPLFMMVAMQAMAAGLTGLWFIDDLDDLLNNLKKLLPHDQYMKVKDFSLKNLMVQNLPDIASYGLVSAVTGTNIHTRMNASDQIPMWPFESTEDPVKNIAGIFPFAQDTINTGLGLATAVSPSSSPKERMAGLYQAAPTVAKGPMENLPQFERGGVSLNPKNLQEGQIRRTEEEKSLRNYGLRSLREQKQKDSEFALSKVERQLQDRVKSQSTKAMDYITSGDPKRAVEHLIKYDQLGGDPQEFINRIPRAKMAEMTTELQRRALQTQGGSKASILKYQRYLQQVR